MKLPISSTFTELNLSSMFMCNESKEYFKITLGKKALAHAKKMQSGFLGDALITFSTIHGNPSLNFYCVQGCIAFVFLNFLSDLRSITFFSNFSNIGHCSTRCLSRNFLISCRSRPESTDHFRLPTSYITTSFREDFTRR